MISLLLTGFEPFGGYSENPSEMIAEELNDQEFSNLHVIGKTISLRYNEIKKEITQLIEVHEPEIIIHLGQASRSTISIEKVAINLANAGKLAYNCGSTPNDEILEPNGPAAYFSTLPVTSLVQSLNDNEVPCYTSYSAGTFGCNQIMYYSLHFTHIRGKTPQTKVGFIHLPLLPVQISKDSLCPSMEYNTMKKGISLAIQQLGK